MIDIQQRPLGDTSQFSDQTPAILQRLYAARGVYSEAQFPRSLGQLHGFDSFVGMSQAITLLAQAVKEQWRIMVVGDFDADGATSSALSVLALRMLGAKRVDYLVPNRFDDGYGLSPEVVAQVEARGADLIMTVDNGVSSIAGVNAAHQAGMKVLVTDHHLPGDVLPAADAMVNPNLNDCGFPSKSLAGVGVAFYVMLALRAHLRQDDWFAQQGISEPNLAELLDLVALGTVADVVALDDNNRILVHQGLARIRAGKCRPGIQALIEVSNREAGRLVASDLGFALGPRINAAGRLDDMSFGVELLLTAHIEAARRMASELDALNQTRKEIEAGMKQEALALCQQLTLNEASLPCGLTLFQRDWHQGVIGILASRIKEQFHRPVIAFADAGDGLLKGSARSIAGLHMRDTLEQVDRLHPGLIVKFGGHAMAAGLSIAQEQYQAFSKAFDQAVSEQLGEDHLKGVMVTDGALQADEFNLATAHLLRQGGPWGQGFPEPLFDGEFKLIQQRLVGQKHLKMMLEPKAGGAPVDAIAFNVDLARWPDLSVKQVRLVYRLDINLYRGNESLQLLVEHIEVL
ncbi:Single-stranded-DNA-specific exonuclease RecJ [Vibrio stylophorae]|uniref:Single-stranded-DNA-specific exonuclease RecJ n=1 Tax=Vibrio stylophorae TaxID=659351 RepID=A0ABM8ZQW1_9VIBR|nr:single-stranded-DNA-specific exonuclease RecJ [Vibrio stylophorae]CAH0532677.1 Single-stranded-DNA-specific exonuclease RecJ [Vibrio stylophorae]